MTDKEKVFAQGVEQVSGLIMESGRKPATEKLFNQIVTILEEERPQNGVVLAALVAIITEMVKAMPPEVAEPEIVGFAKACRMAYSNARKFEGKESGLPTELADVLREAGLGQIVDAIEKGERTGVIEVQAHRGKPAPGIITDAERTAEEGVYGEVRRDLVRFLKTDEEVLSRGRRVTDILNEKGGSRPFSNDRRTAVVAGALMALLEKADWVTRRAVTRAIVDETLNYCANADSHGHGSETVEERARR